MIVNHSAVVEDFLALRTHARARQNFFKLTAEMDSPVGPIDFMCSVKYLGSINAMYPQTGTLENVARLYQKGCAKNDNENAMLTVTNARVSVQSNNNEKRFKLRRIVFCASYKKIPKVVAFNYLVASSPRRLECHAFLCSTNEDARRVVSALTTAFRTAYSEREDWKANSGDQTCKNRKVWTVDAAEEKDFKVIFALPRKIGEIFDSITNCMTIAR